MADRSSSSPRTDPIPGLVVAPSDIPDAGLGLFASQAYEAGTVVAVYSGTQFRTQEALRLPDKSYLMRLGPQSYVDAGPHDDVLARYINDCRNPMLFNVVFDKRPDEGVAHVRAIKDIPAGAEIYVDYGKWYWAGQNPRKLKLADVLARRIRAEEEADAGPPPLPDEDRVAGEATVATTTSGVGRETRQ